MANEPAQTVDEVELPDPSEILAMDGEQEAEVAKPTEPEKPAEVTEEKPKEEPKPDESGTEEKPKEGEEQKPKEGEEPKPDEHVEDDEKERAQRGYSERRQLKQKVTTALSTNPEYTPQTEGELVEQGVDPALAGIEALRQQVQLDKIVNDLTDLNASMNADSNAILRDFPVFDPSKKGTYDEKFARQVENLYKKYSNYQMDEKGGYITRADVPLYEFYAFAAQARGSGTSQGQVQGQKAAENMLSAAEEPSSAPAPKKGGNDSEDDLFLAGLKGEKGTYSYKTATK